MCAVVASNQVWGDVPRSASAARSRPCSLSRSSGSDEFSCCCSFVPVGRHCNGKQRCQVTRLTVYLDTSAKFVFKTPLRIRVSMRVGRCAACLRLACLRAARCAQFKDSGTASQSTCPARRARGCWRRASSGSPEARPGSCRLWPCRPRRRSTPASSSPSRCPGSRQGCR